MKAMSDNEPVFMPNKKKKKNLGHCEFKPPKQDIIMEDCDESNQANTDSITNSQRIRPSLTETKDMEDISSF